MTAAANFVSQLLASAQAKHAEAIAAITARPIDIERCRAADQELAEAELLLADAIDTLDDIGSHDAITLTEAMASLKEQRKLLAQGLANFDVAMAIEAQRRPSPWATPWPWLSLVIIVALLIGSVL